MHTVMPVTDGLIKRVGYIVSQFFSLPLLDAERSVVGFSQKKRP